MPDSTHSILLDIYYTEVDFANRRTFSSFVDTNSGDTPTSETWIVTDTSTDDNKVIAINKTNLKSILIVADGAVTIETNNGTTPDDTWVIDETTYLFWSIGMIGATNPVSVNITNMYVTNASGADVSITVLALEDTP